jgi:hypothetical protein
MLALIVERVTSHR